MCFGLRASQQLFLSGSVSNLNFWLLLPLQETISCLKTAVKSSLLTVRSEVIESLTVYPHLFIVFVSGIVIVE